MINKKVLTILIMSLMFTLLVGCSSVKEYSYDYNKISEISTISLAISDAYNNSSRKSDFKKESKKIIKDLQKTKMKTKEGKDVLKAYGKISKAMRNSLCFCPKKAPLPRWYLITFSGVGLIMKSSTTVWNRS